jgi:uncharacterized protein DUF2625
VTRTLSELNPPDATAWAEICDAVSTAPYAVEILQAAAGRADACLIGLEVTTRSWLGAVAHNSGGLLIDDGWLRVFGAGHAERGLPDILAINGAHPIGCVVAEDVLGGRFLWIPNEDGQRPTVHYYGGDTMEWEDLELGYAEWLTAMIGGAVTEFYSHLRWPGWQAEVAALRLDQGISTVPFLGTRDGLDLSKTSRRAISMDELTRFYGSALSSGPDGPTGPDEPGG